MECLKNIFSPARIFDRALSALFKFGFPSIVNALVFHFKGSTTGQLIRWVNADGLILWLNPKNYIDRLLLSGRQHDSEVIKTLRSEIRPNDIFWDVGANIGYICLTLSCEVPELKTFAFEPSPLTFTQLFENNTINGNLVNLMPFALSSKEGVFPLSVKVNRNSGQSTFFPQSQFHYDTCIFAACQTGDSIIENGIAPCPNVIKIDVEGGEYDVLLGLKDALRSPLLRTIIFEGPTSQQDLIVRLLEASGFEQPIALTRESQTNFLARKSVSLN